jgi:hypothetical protein
MKRLALFFLCLFMGMNNFNAQNVCLDFDGSHDFVTSTMPLGDGDFTVEMWFQSLDNSSSCLAYRRLFSLYGSTGGVQTGLQLGLCGGTMQVYWIDNTGSATGPVAVSPQNFNTGLWNHVAITRSGANLEVFINCQPVWTGSLSSGLALTNFRLGQIPGGPFSTNSFNWLGRIDDVRIWNFPKNQTQIDDQKACVLSCSEPGLELYWTFDEGTPGADNTAIPFVPDCTANGYNGAFSQDYIIPPPFSFNLQGFELMGSTSNYVSSDAPLAYPNLNNLTLEIKDYPYQNNLLTEICNLDPAHFRLLKDGAVPGPFNNVTVEWFYNDGPGLPDVPLPDPPFSGFAFGVPGGNINYDCSSSTTGFVDRTFFAVSTVAEVSQGYICEYKSEEYDLRICCPIRPATIDIAPSKIFCEGEMTNLTISINSPDQFVTNPGPFVTIKWYEDGVYLPAYDNLSSFNYLFTAPSVTTPEDVCFEAVVTNCNGKTETFEECVQIDPEPICGTIAGWPLPNPTNLMLVATSPHLIYEICPGNDAQIGIDVPFQDCIPQWQYSFPGNPSWSNLGLSNSVQNTNILPTSAWPGNQIFYRVQCNPLSSPSGCDPCFSDKIEIRLKTPPPTNAIGGISQLCKGDVNTLTVAFPDPSHTYTWYCDGLQVGTGTSFTYTAMKSACYWFDTDDGCYTVRSPIYCVTVCEVIPALSCPLPPNECACLGDPITLSACDSYSTCPGGSLQFTWYIDGVLQPTTGCTLTHTPPAAGATYKVEIVDSLTGCTASLERTIIPCDKK